MIRPYRARAAMALLIVPFFLCVLILGTIRELWLAFGNVCRELRGEWGHFQRCWRDPVAYYRRMRAGMEK